MQVPETCYRGINWWIHANTLLDKQRISIPSHYCSSIYSGFANAKTKAKVKSISKRTWTGRQQTPNFGSSLPTMDSILKQLQGISAILK